MNPILFIILAIVTVGAALLVILSKNPVSSVLYLVLTFFCIAAFYVILGAQFLAAVQIIVYAGAIMVLFLFVVMLLNLRKIEEKGSSFTKTLGVMAGALIIILFITAFSGIEVTPPDTTGLTPTESLGERLFTQYLIPFEIASVLLLVAIVGAVVLVKKKRV